MIRKLFASFQWFDFWIEEYTLRMCHVYYHPAC
jgi:hypothetical protein